MIHWLTRRPGDAALPLEGQGGHLKRGLRRSFDGWDTLQGDGLERCSSGKQEIERREGKLKVSEAVLQDHVAKLTARLFVEVSKKRGQATEHSQGSPRSRVMPHRAVRQVTSIRSDL